MELTNREKKELEQLEELEKNNIEYSTPASAGILGIFFNSFRTEYKSKEKRQEKLVELRTKKRLYKEGKNTNEHFKRYYEILKKEKEKLKENYD